jgi:hypothetical protein
MRSRKEAELNMALLQFIGKCLAEGDEATLADLGLDRQDVAAIESLYLTDLEHLASLPVTLLRKSALDRDVIHRLVQWVQHKRASAACRDALLRLDAPFPLLQRFYGMDAAEYAARGWRLRVRRHAGRPTEPSETDEAIVWQALQAMQCTDPAHLQPSDYLSLCETTHLPARVVWAVVQRMDRSAPPERQSTHESR